MHKQVTINDKIERRFGVVVTQFQVENKLVNGVMTTAKHRSILSSICFCGLINYHLIEIESE